MSTPDDSLSERIAGKILIDLCPAIYDAACRIAQIVGTEDLAPADGREVTLHAEWAVSIKDGLEIRPAASESRARHLRDRMIDSGFYRPEQLTVVRRLVTDWGRHVDPGTGPA